MWDRVDALLERAPHEEAVRMHRVELLEARRRRAAGLELGTLAVDEATAVMCELVTEPLLARVRETWDGPLVLHKGPEVALDYPGPRLRGYCDLDLLTDDASAAHAALLAAGFVTAREEESFGVPHHLTPLLWPGLPFTVELHSRLNWPRAIPSPSTDELIAGAVPSRVAVDGVLTPAPAPHVLILAAHAWSHEQLGRLGNLIDVAVTLERADEAEVAALARRWGCGRMWRTTRAAIGAVLEDTGSSAAVALWARHLRDVRERSVAEWHVKNLLASVWGLPPRRVPAAVVSEVRATTVADQHEPWPAKARRARLAVRNAGTARSEHLVALEREA
ncbi:MAG TPA: nucleotidyltransferase family protein [Solirubrobacteraceae bacterium]|nr:nucleotidyltransferase family protein [Solirubrobacteraceae bacterium]